MKSMVAAIFAIVCTMAYFAWNNWRTNPGRVEEAMLVRTHMFLSAIDAADKAAISRLIISQSEERSRIDAAPAQAAGTTVADIRTSTAEAKTIWGEKALKELAVHTKRAKTYSVDLDRDTPSIALNFQCETQSPECLEHAYFFFSPGGERISSYITFWNDPDWKQLWDSSYKAGLVTKPCDARCRR